MASWSCPLRTALRLLPVCWVCEQLGWFSAAQRKNASHHHIQWAPHKRKARNEWKNANELSSRCLQNGGSCCPSESRSEFDILSNKLWMIQKDTIYLFCRQTQAADKLCKGKIENPWTRSNSDLDLYNSIEMSVNLRSFCEIHFLHLYYINNGINAL